MHWVVGRLPREWGAVLGAPSRPSALPSRPVTPWKQAPQPLPARQADKKLPGSLWAPLPEGQALLPCLS